MSDAGEWAYLVCALSLLMLMIGPYILRKTMPCLQKFALALPQERSSHTSPTPQGAGIVLIALCIFSAFVCALFLKSELFDFATILWLLLSVFGLMVLGAMDDFYHLSPRLRFIGQMLLCAIIVLVLPTQIHVLPEQVPVLVERVFAMFCLLWIVNLTNFIDGMDGVTMAWFIPSALGSATLLLLVTGEPWLSAFCMLAIASGLVFLPFNLPPARVFLGDSGALAYGAICGLYLYAVAAIVSLPAAMLLGAYPIADATVTLLKRFLHGDKLSQAHRSHLYQVLHHACGLSHGQVSFRIFVFQMACSVLALLLVAFAPIWIQFAVAGALIVAFGLYYKEKAWS